MATKVGYRRLIGKKVYVDIASFYNHYHDFSARSIDGIAFIENQSAAHHACSRAVRQ